MLDLRIHRSTLLLLLLGTCLCLALPASGRAASSNEDLAQTLDEYLRSRVSHGFSGAVLVAHEGEIVLRRGYGTADPESGAPITAETVFDIGSITKPFTAAAILALEMDGKLSTVDDLYRWHLALESDAILSREAKSKLFAPHVPWAGRRDVFYGFGWEVAKTPRGTRVLRHSGGSVEGVNGVVQRFVDEDLVVIGRPAIFSLPAALERRALGPLRVLFVGNSQTSWNDVPALVESLAAASSGLEIDATASTRGGETLMGHSDRTDDDAPLAMMAKGGWDFVVLQEHGGHLAAGGGSTFTAASRLVRAAREAGARPILYSTWARRSKPETQARITETNRQLGERLQVAVAPAGEAFRRLRATNPGIELYRDDEIHGNFAGGYLAACVLFSTLFGQSAEGLPTDSASRDVLAPEIVQILRSEAWAAVSTFR